MMSAVRTEQERRCSMDQNYTTSAANLKDIVASLDTKNFKYSLQPQGIAAQSKSSDYTLKILSYEDGSYCCEGAGCKKLNKNYPACSGLSFPESACAGTESGDDGLGPDPTPEPGIKECVDPAPASSEKCSPCGETRTRTVTCVDGEWKVGAWSASCKTQNQCPITCPEPKPATTEECSPCKDTRTRSVECGSDGQWIIGDWDKECPTECGETCGSAREKGILASFCYAANRLPSAPDPVYDEYPLDPSNCCDSCKLSTCEVDPEKGICVHKLWDYNTTDFLAIRYSEADPVAKIGTEVAGLDLEHFGIQGFRQYGGDSNGVCDFSMPGAEKINASEITKHYSSGNYEENVALCEAACDPSSSSCSMYLFANETSWSPLFVSESAGGDAFCWLSEEQANNRLDFSHVAQTGLTKYSNMSIHCK